MTATGFRNQVKNKNFLNPTGFRFILNRAPKVVFFSNQANIPGLNLGVTEQTSYLTDIPVPGDKLQFQDLTLRFLVDEDLENYLEIQHWLRGLGFPDSLKEIYDWQKSNPNAISNNISNLSNYGKNHPYGELVTEKTVNKWGNFTMDEMDILFPKMIGKGF